MTEISIAMIFFLIIMAFACEYVDSTLGMGYGTTLTPLLIMMGYNPFQIVPVVLISELLSGLLGRVPASTGREMLTLNLKTLDLDTLSFSG